MTREGILGIDRYCQEHKMSYRKRLDELHIPFWSKPPTKYIILTNKKIAAGRVAVRGENHSECVPFRRDSHISDSLP